MKKGTLLAFLSAFFVGVSYPFTAEASKALTPLLLGVIAAFCITVSFSAWLKITGKRLMFKEMMKSHAKDVLSIGILRMSIGAMLLFVGLTMTTVTNAGFISRLEPLLVLLIGVFLLKRKFTLSRLVLTLAIVAGVFLMSTAGDVSSFSEAQLGDLILLASVFFFAYVYFPSARLSKKFGSIRPIALTALIGGIIILPFMLMFTPFESVQLTSYSILVFTGYFTTFPVLGLILWFKALETAKEWLVSAILSVSAVVAAVTAHFWFGETLLPIQVLGAGIILAASMLAAREMR